ncbi:hypothetical protein V6N11_009054 [Hibiscus sabdariffa]|uniref:Uncharacterized protein n=1 Tax=Hibiscus sabdariffa TaxID=183260 RepID=A0ABR2PPH9_9ROSI
MSPPSLLQAPNPTLTEPWLNPSPISLRPLTETPLPQPPRSSHPSSHNTLPPPPNQVPTLGAPSIESLPLHSPLPKPTHSTTPPIELTPLPFNLSPRIAPTTTALTIHQTVSLPSRNLHNHRSWPPVPSNNQTKKSKQMIIHNQSKSNMKTRIGKRKRRR